jgi:hypothetical protein
VLVKGDFQHRFEGIAQVCFTVEMKEANMAESKVQHPPLYLRNAAN